MKRTCRYEGYLTAYADNELSGRLRARVEKHLERCADCRSELDSIRASDRILKEHPVPSLSDEHWAAFRRELDSALDREDREARRTIRLPEARPVFGTVRRKAVAVAAVCVAVLLVVFTVGPLSRVPWLGGTAVAGNECIVDSIESVAAGYTPMFFSSEDPEMTVIWVFSDETESERQPAGASAR